VREFDDYCVGCRSLRRGVLHGQPTDGAVESTFKRGYVNQSDYTVTYRAALAKYFGQPFRCYIVNRARNIHVVPPHCAVCGCVGHLADCFTTRLYAPAQAPYTGNWVAMISMYAGWSLAFAAKARLRAGRTSLGS
jgi:hypothetical protein